MLKTHKYHGNKTFDVYLKNTLPNSLAFRSSDEKEILTLISKFSTKKVSGLNGIPTYILKYINKIIGKPISMIYNLPVLTGQHIEILLQKLNYYGIRGSLNDWFKFIHPGFNCTR